MTATWLVYGHDVYRNPNGYNKHNSYNDRDSYDLYNGYNSHSIRG